MHEKNLDISTKGINLKTDSLISSARMISTQYGNMWQDIKNVSGWEKIATQCWHGNLGNKNLSRESKNTKRAEIFFRILILYYSEHVQRKLINTNHPEELPDVWETSKFQFVSQ